MSDHDVLNVLTWVVAAYLMVSAAWTLGGIGEERKPVTPGGAWTKLVFHSLLAGFLISFGEIFR